MSCEKINFITWCEKNSIRLRVVSTIPFSFIFAMKFKLLQKKERWSGGGWTEPVHLVLFECQHKYFSFCNMLTLISRLITYFGAIYLACRGNNYVTLPNEWKCRHLNKTRWIINISKYVYKWSCIYNCKCCHSQNMLKGHGISGWPQSSFKLVYAYLVSHMCVFIKFMNSVQRSYSTFEEKIVLY